MMMLGGLVAITSLTTAATAAAAAAPFMPTVEIAPGIEMPALSLGTCCGSSPSVGLAPWLTAGGLGVDTAYDYNDQTVIARILASTGTKRESLFITSKIPAGFGGPKDCSGGAEQAMATVKTNLEQLNTTYIDLVLLHKPCHSAAENNALWKGLEQAKASGLVRAIGVSNYKAKDLMALQGTVPAVNQCLMSVSLHDDATISYCQAHNITYEAYEARRPFPSWNRCILTEIYLCHACSCQEILRTETAGQAMRTCPFKNPKALAIAKGHDATVAQVCLRWIYQRGCIMAVGTGSKQVGTALPSPIRSFLLDACWLS
jgi:diketogulonate reductase-like aldo/keto reductase